MTQKIRGGRAILDDLRTIEAAVQKAGYDARDYCIQPRMIEDISRDLLYLARQLKTLGDTLEPMLDRAEQRRASARDTSDMERRLDEQEKRIAALELRVAQLDLERRGVVPFPDRKQQEGR